MRGFLDSFSMVHVNPVVSTIGQGQFSSNTNSIGDINIVINEASISDDVDINQLATRIGQQFTSELSRQGMHISNYNW